MIGHERFRLVMAFLVTLMVINVVWVFIVYDDILFAIRDPFMWGGPTFLSGAFFSSFGCGGLEQDENRQDLLPFGKFLLGIVIGLGFAWDDFILQSDDIRQPWFWSAMVCAYLGWLMGVASLRYYRIRRRKHTEEESPEQETIENDRTTSDHELDLW